MEIKNYVDSYLKDYNKSPKMARRYWKSELNRAGNELQEVNDGNSRFTDTDYMKKELGEYVGHCFDVLLELDKRIKD